MQPLEVSSLVPCFIQRLTVDTSTANAKSMVLVQSIVAFRSLFAFPVCFWGYCRDTSLGLPGSSQYTTHYAPYCVKSDEICLCYAGDS
jgi:hypothetical protein